MHHLSILALLLSCLLNDDDDDNDVDDNDSVLSIRFVGSFDEQIIFMQLTIM